MQRSVVPSLRVLLVSGILAAPLLAEACDKPQAAGSCGSAAKLAATPAPAPAPAEPGMRAWIDPESGTIGGPGALPPPTAEEAALVAPAVQEEPVETVLPDGTVTLDLKGAGMEYYILQLDANGRRVARCVQDPQAALETPPAPQPEDR